MGVFHVFKLYKWYQLVQSASNIANQNFYEKPNHLSGFTLAATTSFPSSKNKQIKKEPSPKLPKVKPLLEVYSKKTLYQWTSEQATRRNNKHILAKKGSLLLHRTKKTWTYHSLHLYRVFSPSRNIFPSSLQTLHSSGLTQKISPFSVIF